MRRHSIDILRGLTMFFMIFVNDLWTLKEYPAWLGHMSAQADGMGFSDVIFPLFLFIVGLSIPLAIDKRYEKGDNLALVLWHIFQRSLALIVMGFFIVNFENINREVMPFSAGLWEVLMAAAFFLFWINYPNGKAFKKIDARWLQGAGIVLLLVLAYYYRGPDGSRTMSPHWWGILGLIGWAYLYTVLVYVAIGKRLVWICLAVALFHYLNVHEFLGPAMGWPKLALQVGASNYALVGSGMLASILLQRLSGKAFTFWIFALALVFIIYGFLLRPFWGISKIQATPSWTAITAGISFACFGILYLIADVGKKIKWAQPLSPAGRSTLTAYLIPYILYPVVAWLGIQVPEFLRTGVLGIIKCLLFASFVILLTRGLELLKIRLKI